MSDRLELNPQFIEAVMSIESGFRPFARNPTSKSTGLIQFMPQTAKQLGTTVDELFVMTAEQQLPFVERFYKPWTGKLKSPGSYYMATFLPNHVGAPLDRVLSVEGEKIYDQNKVLDSNQDGVLTVSDVHAVINRRVQSGMNKPRILVDMSETGPILVASASGGMFELALIVGGLWAMKRWL